MSNNLAKFNCSGHMGVCSAYTDFKLHCNFSINDDSLTNTVKLERELYRLPIRFTVVNLNFSGVPLYGSAQEYFRTLSKGSKHGGVSGIIDEVSYIKIFLAKYLLTTP